MFIDKGIAMLEITATVMGRQDTLHPVLIWNESTAVLIDTCYPGQLPLIQEALNQIGVPLQQLTDIILTHQDIDHIGSLPTLLQTSESPLQVWASRMEQPYIQGEKMLIKISQAAIEQAVRSLPPEVPEEKRQAFRYALEHPPKGKVTQLIGYGDGNRFSALDGLLILDTPGHTPGHISLFHEASRTLIAGDALILQDGTLRIADSRLNTDNDAALRSLEQFLSYPIDQVICYHGGLFRGDVQAQLRSLIG
ncbi:MBL fold metallo-hydrolase [Paenibacillus sp. CF384]|uniref:MBL fold metallo-hydrolase n=1 Tax=Paenibacillus sp. CF384 TaxID=1884382 RepID=UPI0008954704|nr:MBL fold metallo-hydrolase [Paenibacillus sp. CF384]SDW29104.1 Glyoxylase, beta-lactamase superfamily II [Paenibacillus sp. CF384]